MKQMDMPNKRQSTTWKPRTRVKSWTPVESEEIYVYVRLIMQMGIIQKSSIKSYFSKNPILSSPVFRRTISQVTFELISNFFTLYRTKQKIHILPPPPKKKLFKIHPVLTYLKYKFQSMYIPGQNIAVYESLTLCEGRLSFKSIYL
jgi:hypothetical protein